LTVTVDPATETAPSCARGTGLAGNTEWSWPAMLVGTPPLNVKLTTVQAVRVS
jgi:hypothetical protein